MIQYPSMNNKTVDDVTRYLYSVVGELNYMLTGIDSVKEITYKLNDNYDVLVNKVNKSITVSSQNYNYVGELINATRESLQSQIDGNISVYFYDYVPDIEKPPVTEWEDYNKHIDDLFYDTSTGYCYRFQYDSDEYKWTKIEDSDIKRALSDASKAQETADGKMKVFSGSVIPTPPYDAGDLWTIGSAGDLMVCVNAKHIGETYETSDWALATKYTDDTKANEAIESVTNLAKTVTSFKQEYDRFTQSVEQTYVTGETLRSTIEQTSSSIMQTVSTTYATKNALGTLEKSVTSLATQTADKFNWLVKSGTSATDFTLTDRVATLVADDINLNGRVTFSGLSSDTKIKINTAESNANNALNTVEGLEIGGRNLFLRTKDLDKSVWKGTATPIKDDDGFYYYRLRNTWASYAFQDVNLDLREYTCSFYAKADSSVTLEIKEDSKNQAILGYISINSTEWKKYKVTFNITKNADVPRLAFLTRQNTSDICIKKIKLEMGNKATDWTPAPEDTEDSISKVNTKAQGIIDNIYTPNTTTINGGKITTGSIKASSIDVNNLFAQKITATGSITGAKLYAAHVETTSGSIGGFTITNTQIYSDNGTNGNGGTYDLHLGSYNYDTSNHNAILIRTRANTSASWTTKVRLRYDGTAYFGGNDSYVSITDGRIVIAQTTLDGTEANMPRITFKGAYGVDNSSCSLVYAGNKSLNWNGNFLAKGDIVTIGDIHSGGDISATNQLKAKSIELSAETSFIDFHYNSSTADYTSRIRESASGVFTFQCDSIRMSPMTSGGTPMFRSASGVCQFGASSDSYVCYISGSEVRVCNTSRKSYKVIKASAFTVSSSRRLKINVEKMTDEEADKIYDLDVVTFDYINGDRNQRGLIAEDVYKIIPSMVQGDVYADDEDYESIMGIGIDYSKAVPYLIKAIQNLKKEINKLKGVQL